MSKENILYSIIGLLAGLILGFVITNSINRSYSSPAATQAGPADSEQAGSLPPDHPPLSSAGSPAGSDASGGAPAAGGPPAEVMAVIEKAKKEPGNAEAQVQAAALYSQIGRYQQALELYEKAYKIKPNNLDVLRGLGNVSFDLKKYPEAERWYQQALKVKPDDANIRTDLGLTFYLREPRDLDRAIAIYKEVLQGSPRHEQALQNLTQALLAKGDRQGARAALAQLQQVNPGNQAIDQFHAALEK
jgi:tetratricopeptide (TPR) repeat protein